MSGYLDMRHPVASHTSPLSFLKRYVMALALAAVLAAVEVDRPGVRTEPTPIVLTTKTNDKKPPRICRVRPYRAHYRRRGRRLH